MNSILDTRRGVCMLCGAQGQTELHHIFGGALRKKSGRYGLVVCLCHACHNEPPDGVHFNAESMLRLKQEGQRAYMERYRKSKETFIAEFGKNYL